MVRYGSTAWPFLCISILAGLLTYCRLPDPVNRETSQYQATYDSMIERAKRLNDTDPDRMIRIADSAIKLASGHPLKPGRSYVAFRLKADASREKGDHDSVLAVMEQARAVAKRQLDSLSLALTELYLGQFRLENGQYYMAEKHLLDAIGGFERFDDKDRLVRALIVYGQSLTERGEYARSQKNLLRAYQILQRLDRPEQLYSLCIDIGNNHAEMNRFNDALHYYRIAERGPYKSDKDPGRISALMNIGILYRSKNPDSAMHYYNLAMNVDPQGFDPFDRTRLKLNLANLFLEKEELDSALNLYREVAVECTAQKIYPGLIRALNGISGVYDKQGDFARAIQYEQQALNLANSTGDQKLAVILLEELASLNIRAGKASQSVIWLKKAKKLADSIHTIDRISATQELETINAEHKKELEYDRMTHELSQEKFRKRFNLFLTILFAIASVILSFFLGKIYLLYRERRHAYEALMEKYLRDRADAMAEPSGISPAPAGDRSAANAATDPLLQSLVDYFQSEKPYLDPRLRIETVTERLSCSHRSLIQALKNHKYSSFSSFTNFYRVEEAIRMMEDPKYKNYKIEAIATESGFGTRMSFYNAFEKQTGIKPSFFRNTLLQKMAS